MRESDLRLSDLFVLLLRKWRNIVTVGLVLALCLGIGATSLKVINWTDPEAQAKTQAKYETKMEQYLAAVGEIDGKIQTNKAQILVAQSELTALPGKKESYEKNIADLKAAIENNKDQIAVLEQRAEQLKANQEDAQSQLELLNVQAAMSQSYADMRLRETDLALMETELMNLPVKEAELIAAIAKHENAIQKLQVQRLDEKEPSKPGMSLKSGVVYFVKLAVIGGIVGVLLAIIWILFATISRGKLLSAKQAAAADIAALGVWPDVSKKKFLSCVDRWVIRVTGKTQPDAALVCANIAALGANQRILICGGAARSDIDEIAAQLKQSNAAADVICAGSHLSDAKESLYTSDMETICDLKERAQKMEKTVLGMVLV